MDFYQYHSYAWEGSFDGRSPFEVSMIKVIYCKFRSLLLSGHHLNKSIGHSICLN